MSGPQRLQLSRRRGFDLQAASKALNGLPALRVTRPGPWGNPFSIKGWNCTPTTAVDNFRDLLERAPVGDGRWSPAGETVYETIRRELGGRDLACWCPLDQPCHADVLLTIANAPEEQSR